MVTSISAVTDMVIAIAYRLTDKEINTCNSNFIVVD